jgi:glycerol-3-phosphate cytidylyltransferase
VHSRTVLTLGSFDTFHVGHIELLQACRELAGPKGRVVVALNSSDFIREYKGHWPTQTYEERRVALELRPEVDEVYQGTGRHSWVAIYRSGATVIAIGDDWLPRERYLKQLDMTDAMLESFCIEIVFVPRTTGQSSTKIREGS